MTDMIKVMLGFIGIVIILGLLIFGVPFLFMLLFNRVAPVYGANIVLGYWDAFCTVWLFQVMASAMKGVNFKLNKKSE